MPITKQCRVCSKDFTVVPALAEVRHCCSNACRGKWRSMTMQGADNFRWKAGFNERYKNCAHCGKQFSDRPAIMKKQKFCSKHCADQGGFRYSGKEHPNYREDARRKNRGGKHHGWRTAVISRDGAKCQKCGAGNIELHAHHIKPYQEFPELRFDVDNGITLCHHCHWLVHTAESKHGVNSVDPLTDNAEGNTEPSLGGNILEGVSTNGRAYRRWNGNCHWCGEFVSKPLSDVKPYRHVFCSRHCSGKHKAAFRTHRPTQNMEIPYTAVIPTRAPCSKEMI